MTDKTEPNDNSDFKLVSRIGSGGMGSVYEAIDPKTSETVAVKFLDTEGGGGGAERELRFRREIEILKHLNHRHIVRVLNNGESDKAVPYFVMEFVSGGTLRDRMKSNVVPPEEVIRVVRQMSSALDYLHANGVIHRDLKPENVLVLDDGTIKLTDFGISSFADVGPTQLTTTGQVLGTFEYMSPEQRHRLPIDHRADIYSLAVVTYELLTARRPAGRFRSASEWNPDVPVEVDIVLNRALSEEAEDRYDSCHEYVDQLIKAFRFKSIQKRATIIVLGTVVLLMAGALAALSEWVFPATEKTVKNPPPQEVVENQTPEYYLILADTAATNGDWATAVECSTQALRLDRDHIDARLYRAHAYYATGAKPEALADLDRVLAIEPDNPDAPSLKGRILKDLGDYQEAIIQFNKVLKLNPGDVISRTFLGECLYKMGLYIEALKAVQKAIKANDPLMPGEAYYYSAMVRAKVRDWKRAREDLRTWVEKHPDNPLAVTALGQILIQAPESSGIRDLAVGLDLCQRAFEMRKTEGMVLRNYASALLANGKLTRAKEIAELALKHSLGRKVIASRRLIEKIEHAIAADEE
jgi:serine/threonine protein kinase